MKIKSVGTCLAGFVIIAAMMISPSCAAEREDTAHLVFKKTVSVRDKSPVYVVQKGDVLVGILRRELDARPEEIGWMLKEVKRRNPGLKDVNVIEPGRKINLPAVSPPEGYQTYRVQKGDYLARILQKNLDLKGQDLAAALKDVKKQNPNIRDINLIFPGQRIFIPRTPAAEKEKAEPTASRPPDTAAVVPETKPVLLTEKELALIRRVVERAGGTVLTDGNYYIPLSASDQVTVDCASVPVVELDDGSRILVDFGSQVPPELKEKIQRIWKNYAVVQESSGLGALPALEQIFKSSKQYSFKKMADYADVGREPQLRMFLDWALTKKDVLFTGVALRENALALMPAALTGYAEKNGVSVLEIGEGLEVVRDNTPPPPPADVPALKSGSQAELVESLLATLGYSASRDAWVKVNEPGTPAKVVSVKVDFLMERPDKTIVINLRDLPESFQEALKNQGASAAIIRADDEKRVVIEKTAAALGLPFTTDAFDFKGPDRDGKPRWVIRVPATRVSQTGGDLFLTPLTLDGRVYGYMLKTWEMKLIRY
jgi:hypothetical protein